MYSAVLNSLWTILLNYASQAMYIDFIMSIGEFTYFAFKQTKKVREIVDVQEGYADQYVDYKRPSIMPDFIYNS